MSILSTTKAKPVEAVGRHGFRNDMLPPWRLSLRRLFLKAVDAEQPLLIRLQVNNMACIRLLVNRLMKEMKHSPYEYIHILRSIAALLTAIYSSFIRITWATTPSSY
jgi:hypothetical protein